MPSAKSKHDKNKSVTYKKHSEHAVMVNYSDSHFEIISNGEFSKNYEVVEDEKKPNKEKK